MAEYVRKYQEDYVRPSPGLFLENYDTTSGDVFGASVALSFDTFGYLTSGTRDIKAGLREGRLTPGLLADDVPESKVFDVERVNELGKPYGLKFDGPTREDVFNIRLEARKNELRRRSIIDRGPQTFTGGAANLAGGLFGAVADPVNVALSFVPIVGEARFAQLVSVFGKTGARFTKGVVEGTVGAAIAEPGTLYLASRAQADYGMYDSLMNITFGGIIGGGLHLGTGYIKDRISGAVERNAIPDRIEQTNISTKETALRSAFADAYYGRPIDVEPILHSDPAFRSVGENLRSVDIDYRSRQLSPENIQRIERRFDSAILEVEGKFESRPQANEYIRARAKEEKAAGNEQASRSDYITQKTEDGFEVYRAKEAKIETDAQGNIREFKSFEDAKKYADELGDEYKAVSFKPEPKKSTQKHVVVKGNVDVEKIRNDVAGIYTKRQIPEAGRPFTRLDRQSLVKFSEEKGGLSAVAREATDVPEIESHYRGTGAVAEAQKALDESLEKLSEMDNFIEKNKVELEKAGIDFKELEQADLELKEAQSLTEKIKNFAFCMGRG